ncbi:MAG: hypothetical protein U0625_00545 [Phycisphaerales bacterium]
MSGSSTSAAVAASADASAAPASAAALTDATPSAPASPLAPQWAAAAWRARPARAIFAACSALLLAAAVAVAAGDWLWGALALVAFVLATIDAYLPVRYQADAQSLAIHGTLRTRRVAWSEVRRVALDPSGDAAFLVTGHGRRPRGATVLLDSPARGEWLRAHLPAGRAA